MIGTNQTGAQTRACTRIRRWRLPPECVPLGVLGPHFSAPKGKGEALEEKKSFQWTQGFQECAGLTREFGRGKLVCVMDREADMFPLFEEQRVRPEAELLVRAKGRCSVAGASSLLDDLRAEPVRARAVVSIDRLTARPKSGKRKAREGRASLSAAHVLRPRSVQFALAGRAHRSKWPIQLTGRARRGGAHTQRRRAHPVGVPHNPRHRHARGLPPHRGKLLPALAHLELAPGPYV